MTGRLVIVKLEPARADRSGAALDTVFDLIFGTLLT
jgi:hypothetical protein